jgi:peptide/nickel transport system permease protein
MPGQAKIVSVTIANAISDPNSSPATVTTGIRMFFSTCVRTMPLSETPFARAKGLTNKRVIGVHVLRNILIPIVTVIGLQFGTLIGFAIVTESVFAWPGMGKLLIDSIGVLDRPVIVAYLLVIVTVFIVINLLVDVLYSVLDPRIRLSDVKG